MAWPGTTDGETVETPEVDAERRWLLDVLKKNN